MASGPSTSVLQANHLDTHALNYVLPAWLKAHYDLRIERPSMSG